MPKKENSNRSPKRPSGYNSIGSGNNQAKIDEDTARLIKQLLPHLTRREISNKLEVPKGVIDKIAQGVTWLHV